MSLITKVQLAEQKLLLKSELIPMAAEFGWPGDVRVRETTAAEGDDYEGSLYHTDIEVGEDGRGKTVAKRNYANAKARLVVKCMVNEDGSRFYSLEEEEKAAEAMGGLGAAPVNRLFQAISDLSGTSKKARAALESKSVTGGDTSSATSSPAGLKAAPATK